MGRIFALAIAASFVCIVGLDSPLGSRSVGAGTAVRLEIDELVDRSDLAVEARVLSATAVRAPRGRIDTEYQLSVDRTFWGDDQGTRTIRLPGGILPEGRGLVVPGVPRLLPGEDVILMLTSASPDGMRMPVGLAQGQFRIVTGREGRRSAVRAQGALSLVDPATGEPRPVGAREMDYAELLARVESAAAAKRAREATPPAGTGSDDE